MIKEGKKRSLKLGVAIYSNDPGGTVPREYHANQRLVSSSI